MIGQILIVICVMGHIYAEWLIVWVIVDMLIGHQRQTCQTIGNGIKKIVGSITKEQQKFWDLLRYPFKMDCGNCKFHDYDRRVCTNRTFKYSCECLGWESYVNTQFENKQANRTYWEWNREGFNKVYKELDNDISN